MIEFYNQKLSRIGALIAQANSEQQHGWALEKFLRAKASSLHHSISTVENDPVESLIGFVRNYINSSPIDLAEFKRNTIEAHIETETEALFNIAVDYFLKPSEFTAKHSGLLMLMDAAYLSHRLLEEINDHFLANSNITLCSSDNTQANLIMHALIGEEFANELDTAVYYSTESLMSNSQLFKKPEFLIFVKSRLQHSSPCSGFDNDSSVKLSFSGLE